MSFLTWILLGLTAGMIAQAVAGGRRHGCIFTIVLGVAGALIGGALFNLVGGDGSIDSFTWGSLLTAVIGAFILILISDGLSRGKGPQ